MSLPGGCAIGNRPIDLHLKALEALGARDRAHGRLCESDRAHRAASSAARSVPDGLGRRDRECADGGCSRQGHDTVIENAAREPEITDLAQCLIAMGADIEGLRTDTLTIQGRTRLHGADLCRSCPTGSRPAAMPARPLITGGSLELAGAREDIDAVILSGLTDAGALVEVTRAASPSKPTARSGRCRFRPRLTPPFRPTCRRSSWQCWPWPRARACSPRPSRWSRSRLVPSPRPALP